MFCSPLSSDLYTIMYNKCSFYRDQSFCQIAMVAQTQGNVQSAKTLKRTRQT